jgi:hypothetical protein
MKGYRIATLAYHQTVPVDSPHPLHDAFLRSPTVPFAGCQCPESAPRSNMQLAIGIMASVKTIEADSRKADFLRTADLLT